jgi:hypothetical protein
MSTYEDDIPTSARHAIQAKLAEIRAEIRDAKDSYDLSTDTISNRRRFSAKLSILAIDVTECRPEGCVANTPLGRVDGKPATLMPAKGSIRKSGLLVGVGVLLYSVKLYTNKAFDHDPYPPGEHLVNRVQVEIKSIIRARDYVRLPG